MTPSGHRYSIGDPLRIATDRFAPFGVPRGTIVHVLECHEDGGYEVEVRGEDGRTMDWFGAREEDLAPAS